MCISLFSFYLELWQCGIKVLSVRVFPLSFFIFLFFYFYLFFLPGTAGSRIVSDAQSGQNEIRTAQVRSNRKIRPNFQLENRKTRPDQTRPDRI